MKILNFIHTEAILMLRSKSSLIWFFVMPLVYTLFFGLATRDTGGVPKTWLGVADQDRGFLSQALIRELQAEEFEIHELKNAPVRLSSESPRVLIIPAGFSADAPAGKKVTLVLRKGADTNVKAGSAAEANIYRAMIRLIGNLALMETEKSGGSPDPAAVYARTAAQKARVTVHVERAGKLKAIPHGFNHTLPAMTVMFVLMCVLIYGIHLLITEKTNGLLRRVAVGPVSTTQILAGKLLSRAAVGVIQVAVLALAGRLLFGVYFGNSPLGLLLLMTAYIFCVAAISLVIGALVRTRENATGLSILITLVMSAIGGCWWPLEIVPSPVREAAFAFPTGWAMDGLHQLMAFGNGLATVWVHILVLAGMFAAFFSLAVWLLRRELAAGN